MPNAPRRNYPITSVRDAEGYPTNHMAKWMEDVDQALDSQDFGFSVYSSSNQSLTSSVYTDISWGASSFDLGGHFDISSNSVTIPESGVYFFSAKVMVDSYSDGNQIILRLVKDGANAGHEYFRVTSSSLETKKISGVEYFEAGEVIKIAIRPSAAGGNINSGANNTTFSMKKLV